MDSTSGVDIVVLAGDGVGPEVTEQAVAVLGAAFEAIGIPARFDWRLFGGAAIDETGEPFPDTTREACLGADAVLLGAVGGASWDDLEPALRPERGLLELRNTLGTFANLRPVQQYAALADASVIRSDAIAGVDLLVVRELTGGIYFGPGREFVSEGERIAESVMVYSETEIRRIARVGFEAARSRRGRVVSVDKANVLDVSRLWRAVVSEVHAREYADVSLSHGYIDSTAMRLVQDPASFDVILTANLFGDILSDLAGALPGSLGMLPSSCIGGSCGIYEPVHGSAPDIAGTGKANPYGAILSGAMLLNDLGHTRAATAVRHAVGRALDAGYHTSDLARGSKAPVSTAEAGSAVLANLSDAFGDTSGGSKASKIAATH